jgi:hypothetical protein
MGCNQPPFWMVVWMTETNADFQMDWDNIRIFLSTDRSVHRSLALTPKDST